MTANISLLIHHGCSSTSKNWHVWYIGDITVLVHPQLSYNDQGSSKKMTYFYCSAQHVVMVASRWLISLDLSTPSSFGLSLLSHLSWKNLLNRAQPPTPFLYKLSAPMQSATGQKPSYLEPAADESSAGKRPSLSTRLHFGWTSSSIAGKVTLPHTGFLPAGTFDEVVIFWWSLFTSILATDSDLRSMLGQVTWNSTAELWPKVVRARTDCFVFLALCAISNSFYALLCETIVGNQNSQKCQFWKP